MTLNIYVVLTGFGMVLLTCGCGAYAIRRARKQRTPQLDVELKSMEKELLV